MVKFKDLTGHQFGHWTVIKLINIEDRGVYKQTKWLCKCSCGVEKIISPYNFTRVKNPKCLSCRRDEKSIDISNQKFGYLVALSKSKQIKNGAGRLWICKCLNCYNFITVSYASLKKITY